MKSGYPRLTAAATILLTQSAFATDVPGSGAEELVRIVLAILGVGVFSGIVSGMLGRANGRLITAFLLPIVVLPGIACAINGSLRLDSYFELVMVSAIPYVPSFFIGCWLARGSAPAPEEEDRSIAKRIEILDPEVQFIHVSQTTHYAQGQCFVIHICHIPTERQYRAYVFCNEALVAWRLDPRLDHSADPDSPAGKSFIEKLIADTVNGIIEKNFDFYSDHAA